MRYTKYNTPSRKLENSKLISHIAKSNAQFKVLLALVKNYRYAYILWLRDIQGFSFDQMESFGVLGLKHTQLSTLYLEAKKKGGSQ